MMQRDAQAEADQARTLEGMTLEGRYRLDAFVGQGGFASVFRATDLRMHTEVAIKVAKPQAEDNILQRFEHETTLGARLPPHPSIARSTDRGVIPGDGPYAGQPFLVTDFVDGESLDKRLVFYPGPYPIANALRVASDLTDALQHLHSQGIVHRDVKPTNVMVRNDGSAVLVDFGLAFATGDGDTPRSPDLTEARKVVGTGHYMSPEQAVGFRPDYSFDVYALGATLFETLVGTPPLSHIDDGSVRQRKLTEKITPIGRLRHDAPADFADLVNRMLSIKAEDRPTLGHIRKKLRGLLSGPMEIGRATIAKRIYDDAGPDACVAIPVIHAHALLARQNAAAAKEAAPPSPPAQPEPEAEPDTGQAEPEPPLSRRVSEGRSLPLALLAFAFVMLGLSLALWYRRTNTVPPARLAPSLSFPSRPASVAAPAPEVAPKPETPRPDPDVEEPEVEPLEIPDAPSPRKKKPKPPATHHEDTTPSEPDTAPPENGAACVETRAAAKQAFASGRPTEALRHTKDRSCWRGHEKTRQRYRVAALYELGKYAACAREGKGATLPETLNYAKLCESKK